MHDRDPHTSFDPTPLDGVRQPISRRRLFELGGAAAAMAAFLAACGNDSGGDPGRVGLAPRTTALPSDTVDDVVYLRTLQSLEESIIGIHERLAADGGLDGAAAEALERFTADHTAAAEELGALVADHGGDPFACPNPWYESRFFQPALTNVFGGEGPEGPILPSDDIRRDALALIHALEALTTSSALHFVPLVSTSELRQAMAAYGATAARRAATAVLLIHPAPGGYLLPDLITADGGEVPEDEAASIESTPETTAAPEVSEPTDGSAAPAARPAAPIPRPYVISARFQQLTAVNIEIGAPNDLGLRYKAAWETPAENAFVYRSVECSA